MELLPTVSQPYSLHIVEHLYGIITHSVAALQST